MVFTWSPEVTTPLNSQNLQRNGDTTGVGSGEQRSRATLSYDDRNGRIGAGLLERSVRGLHAVGAFGHEAFAAGVLDFQGAEQSTTHDLADALDFSRGAGFELDKSAGLGAMSAAHADLADEPAHDRAGRELLAARA